MRINTKSNKNLFIYSSNTELEELYIKCLKSFMNNKVNILFKKNNYNKIFI